MGGELNPAGFDLIEERGREGSKFMILTIIQVDTIGRVHKLLEKHFLNSRNRKCVFGTNNYV